MGWVNLFSDHSHNHLTLIVLFFLSTPRPLLGLPFGTSDYNNWNYLLEAMSVVKAGCADQCGDITIPYPFGIRGNNGPNDCYYNDWYEIVCNASFDPPRPFLSRLNVELMGVIFRGQVVDSYEDVGQAVVVRTMPQNVCSSGVTNSVDLRGSPYRFLTQSNELIVEGCSGITVTDRTENFLTACGSNCLDNTTLSCDSGIGCCLASLGVGITDLDFYQMTSKYDTGAGCNTKALLLDKDGASLYSGNFSELQDFGTILQWRIMGQLLDIGDHANFSCDSNLGSCVCKEPYDGNPYLSHGCKEKPVDCSSYFWYHRCKKHHLLRMAIILGSSIGLGLLLLPLCGYWLYRFARRKIEIKRKSKHFKKNGGLLLQQQISSTEGVVNKTKIFTLTELERATDNFNENRILGQGGQGTVYKGMMEDGKIVAIKKSKIVSEDQLDQFINEVVIVSQINHRYVVKLLGCCLETEVPLLVYEFVPNGTLYHHMHYPSEDFCVTWKMRLQIAAQSAYAVAYLHSSTSPPIFHRDIKSSNILLDDKYRAKVSDFGTSKVITIEQTHVTTCVQGTYGYLDPEYFQSNQFTEKSDVYSFGVVLVELITGKKPICPTKSGGWISLASEFLYHMESSTLDDILDPRVLKEGEKEELIAVAKLARQCLKRNGKRRPTMKEVAKILDEIKSPNQESTTPPNYVKNNDQFSSTTIEMHNLSLPDIQMVNCLSIEVQPLILNTM